MEERPRIAVIGGGFTGAAAVLALLRNLRRPFDIILFEPDDLPGHGAAYGRARPEHVLNTPASRLSTSPDEPAQFVSWIMETLSSTDPCELCPDEVAVDFMPRALFGRFVQSKLSESLGARPEVRMVRIPMEATELGSGVGRLHVSASALGPIPVTHALLATGYGTAAAELIGEDPYGCGAMAGLDEASRVAIIGTGLSMIDTMISLRAAGYSGRVAAISRHGLVPRPHAELGTAAFPVALRTDLAPSRMLRAVREAVRRARARNIPWQAAVDGLRGQAGTIWNMLDSTAQRRVLRHLRPIWNVHRHRVDPRLASFIDREVADGTLEIVRAQVMSSVTGEGGVEIGLRRHGTRRAEIVRFDRVFDCSGVRPALESPLISQMIASGMASRDRHGLGIVVSESGRVAGRSGQEIYALGPLGLGSQWEVVSVPEIVEQCAAMAAEISASIDRASPDRSMGMTAAE